MRDDPRQNLKWMAQELLSAEMPGDLPDDTADLLARVDRLLEEEPEPPAFAQRPKKKTKGERAEYSHIRQQFDPSAAVLTKTKRQLRQEAKQRKKAEKKATVNRKIGGLLFLAILECMGILVLLGWWLQ